MLDDEKASQTGQTGLLYQPDYEPARDYDPSGASVPMKHQRHKNVTFQALQTVIGSAIIVATLFTMWMPGRSVTSSASGKFGDVISSDSKGNNLNGDAQMPANFPLSRVGIVVGHRGNGEDPGAVCSDGLSELQVNSTIATYVQQKLDNLGYEVILLDEFDPRLQNFKAGLVLSIHNDSCDYINNSATGFKVAAALSPNKRNNSERLIGCLANRYAKITGLNYHPSSVTNDMTFYHAFTEINPWTTAGIIETGFLNLDRQILTQKPELIADGIVSGVKCYMNQEVIDPSMPFPAEGSPTAVPIELKTLVPQAPTPTPGGVTPTP
ncbi:MAG: N-acetylmuramoyl-L-alanine amidase [Anaerolineaceae bacterium]|nr:N-acetylmuramoyl-L-alanine amidase [Anaerolineaceae bacterium]